MVFQRGNKYGKTNKGRIFSQETRKKLSELRIGKPLSEETKHRMTLSRIGKKFTEEHKRNMSKGNKGILKSEETKDKLRMIMKGKHNSPMTEITKESRKKMIVPIKDTSIELKIQSFLKQLGIEYFTHQYIKIEHGYQCDILIPSMNLVIECDGNYWHKYPIGNDIDHIRTKELLDNGFKVLRLWEFEINNMTLEKFKERLA
jgi:very-short-patch-repair endonuclease